MKEIINTAVDLARQAGDFLIASFGKIKEIKKKGDRDFATNLDREAEKMIVDAVKIKFPEHGIIGEEGGSSNLSKEYIWIIDPLDGTHNFMRNINIFGVSIGIMKNNRFVAGAVYMPVEKEMYVGEKGNGAYKNGCKISVSSITELKECSISFDSSIRYAPDLMLKTLKKLSCEVFNVRMFGSSARALTYVSEGVLDFSVEFYDRPWDFAGSVAIIEEAGGVICDLKGNAVTHKTIGYIASNRVIFGKVKELVFSEIIG